MDTFTNPDLRFYTVTNVNVSSGNDGHINTYQFPALDASGTTWKEKTEASGTLSTEEGESGTVAIYDG